MKPIRVPLIPPHIVRRILEGDITRSVRSELAGVYVAGPRPPAAAVVAANHGSWWDGYLLGLLARQLGTSAQIMMSREQLDRYPFLRAVGARPPSALRELARTANAGQWAVIFPEGTLQASREIASLHPGAAWLTHHSGAPLVPAAVRVRVRGARKPEAFLLFGRAIEADELADELGRLVTTVDHTLDSSDPEQIPPGFRPVSALMAPRSGRELAAHLLTALQRKEP